MKKWVLALFHKIKFYMPRLFKRQKSVLFNSPYDRHGCHFLSCFCAKTSAYFISGIELTIALHAIWKGTEKAPANQSILHSVGAMNHLTK